MGPSKSENVLDSGRAAAGGSVIGVAVGPGGGFKNMLFSILPVISDTPSFIHLLNEPLCRIQYANSRDKSLALKSFSIIPEFFGRLS